MTTNDDAFEKWRNDTPQDCCLDMTVEEELEYRLLQAWQAAKADSERQTGEMVRAISLAADAREAALESEVAELKAKLEMENRNITNISDRNIAYVKENLILKQHCEKTIYEIMLIQVKNLDLFTSNIVIRDALNGVLNLMKSYDGISRNNFENLMLEEIENIEKALSATTSESLQAHDDMKGK